MWIFLIIICLWGILGKRQFDTIRELVYNRPDYGNVFHS